MGVSQGHTKDIPVAVSAPASGAVGGTSGTGGDSGGVSVGVSGVGVPPVVLMPLSNHSAHTPLQDPDTIAPTTTAASFGFRSAPSSPSSRPSSSSASPKSHQDKGYPDKDRGLHQHQDKGSSQQPITEAALALAAAVAEAELQVTPLGLFKYMYPLLFIMYRQNCR